jgi:glutaryl-CoA dehydrogenase
LAAWGFQISDQLKKSNSRQDRKFKAGCLIPDLRFAHLINPVFKPVSFRLIWVLLASNFDFMAAKTDVFQSPDYFLLDELLTDEQKLIRESVRSYVKKEISPIIEEYAQKAEFPTQIIRQMGDLGCFGPTIPEVYGGGGLDYISYGLMMQELERGDSGVRSTASVQGSLVMFPIHAYGSEEMKKRMLPKLATGEWLGCFGLTEPDHGSNPGGMLSNIRDAGDHVILNGSKMWISNAPFAQIAVVWAKDEEGEIRGLVVERGMEGFSTPTTHGKWSLRASATGELVFDHVKVPKANIFPEIRGLKGPLSCLTKARYGIAWGSVGAAMDCYDTALRYSQERIQFGRPIGGFQLQQKKLAEMITEITKAQLMNWRLGVLMNEKRATPAQVSMAKRNGCEIATNIAREARQMLGGMGITGEYPIMRHLMNMESVLTYEGTHDVHLLITGMDITGINAFM